MASNPKQEREARARLRAYQARQSVHERRTTRRARDNWLAAIGLVVVLGLAAGAQLLLDVCRNTPFGCKLSIKSA